MEHYCVGFLFDRDCERVVLIQKLRPAWQAGKLNGIGGHVENGETGRAAMAREFYEEAGFALPESCWIKFADWHGPDYRVEFFRAAVDSGPKAEAFDLLFHSCTDEKVTVVRVATLLTLPVISNLRFLVPLAAYGGIESVTCKADCAKEGSCYCGKFMVPEYRAEGMRIAAENRGTPFFQFSASRLASRSC